MIKKNNPWLCCAVCTLLLFCTVGLSTSSFSVYQPFLISIVGLTNTESSMFLTIRTLSGLLSTFLVQRYLRITGIKRGVFGAALMVALSFFVLGLAHSFALCCFAAVLMGFGYGFGGMVSVSIIIHRVFDKKMGLALSICAAGTGLSMVVRPPLVTWMISSLSLRTSLWAETVFVTLCALAVLFFLTGDAEPSAASGKTRSSASFRSLGMRFILTFTAMILVGTIGNVGWSHFSVLYSTEGFSETQVALLISVVGTALTIGKLLFGECADRIGNKRTAHLSSAIAFIGLVMSCFAGTRSMFIALASMICLGLSLPIATVGPGLFAKDLGAPEHFDFIVRQLQLAYMIGSLAFGPVPGMLADRCGSYVPAFEILTVFAAVIFLLLYLVYKDIDDKPAHSL